MGVSGDWFSHLSSFIFQLRRSRRHQLHDLLRRIRHGIARNQLQARFVERVLAGGDVVAFQPDDERELEAGGVN